MMNNNFYVNVWELMKSLLPRPRPKVIVDILDQDRAETLDELQIIHVACVDADYKEFLGGCEDYGAD